MYWGECKAVVCLPCSTEKEPWQKKSILCESEVLTHLESAHTLDIDSRSVLGALFKAMPSLAKAPEDLLLPTKGLEPRDFLPEPAVGWTCPEEGCEFATDEIRIMNVHCISRHGATLKSSEKRAQQTLCQHADGIFFPVIGAIPAREEQSSPHFSQQQGDDRIVTSRPNNDLEEEYNAGLEMSLYFWEDCHAIICSACPERPMLCRNTVLGHVLKKT